MWQNCCATCGDSTHSRLEVMLFPQMSLHRQLLKSTFNCRGLTERYFKRFCELTSSVVRKSQRSHCTITFWCSRMAWASKSARSSKYSWHTLQLNPVLTKGFWWASWICCERASVSSARNEHLWHTRLLCTFSTWVARRSERAAL